jgi:hypothetical protein
LGPGIEGKLGCARLEKKTIHFYNIWTFSEFTRKEKEKDRNQREKEIEKHLAKQNRV